MWIMQRFSAWQFPALHQLLRQTLIAVPIMLGGPGLEAWGGEIRNAHKTPPSEVFEWNDFATDLVAKELPPIQTQTLAITQIAVHDALNAIDRQYQPYEYAGSANGASMAAAIAAATRDTLIRMLPTAAPQIEARYVETLNRITDGASKSAGIATGQAAAAAILARRGAEDLFAAFSKPYTPGAPHPGVYQATPPFNAVFLAGWGELVPFALRGGNELRSRPPLSVSSRLYAMEYREVKELGSANSTRRSAEQTETARFWYDVATKEWHRAAQQGLKNVPADAWQAARVLALMSIAMADGVIASAETKFHFNYWRPITAIRAGESDGNRFTRGDLTWEPLCPTPPFPEYNSTHAVTGAAAAKVLAQTVGDRHRFTVISPTLVGVSRTYDRFSEAAAEEARSRIFCGIHFRSGMYAGLAQGRQVAHKVVKRLLRPIHADNRYDDGR